jgi:exonuclease III
MNWLLLLLVNIVVANADTDCPYITSKEDRRSNKNTLRIVQYNVEWLFIDYYSPTNCPGSGCSWVNQSEAETHMDAVAKVVKELNPDIINFCEVEGCDELNMLKDKLDDDTYTSYLIKGTDTSTGQNVGMLTRIDPLVNLYRTELRYDYPITNSTCGYTGLPGSSGVTKHYITEFSFNGYNIAFIAAHLLAIPTDPTRCAQREAQATVLQNEIMLYIDKGFEIIMLGDFNDYDAEIMDVNNHQPTSRVLDILKGYQSRDYYKLITIAEEILQPERYSDWWDSDNNCNTASSADYSMLDHILVTEPIKKMVENVYIYHNYDEYCGKYNSDHYPIVVELIT